MTEEKQDRKSRIFGRLDSSSKLWKTFWTVTAVLLMFAGPTYVPLILIRILEVDYFLSMFFGIALFIVGLALTWYLIRKKVIS